MISHPRNARNSFTATTSRQTAEAGKESKIIRLPRRARDDGGSRTIVDEMAEFLLSRRALNCTPPTIRWYERCLGKLRDYMAEHELSAVRQISAATVRRFLVSLNEAGHSPGGVATLFTGVRAFLNWCKVEYNLDAWEPLTGTKPPKRPQDPLQPVSLSHVLALIDACPIGKFTGDRDRALLYFLLDSGMRHQELSRLRVGQVNLSTGRVEVRWGKGRKRRVVFVGEQTRTCLTAYLKHRPGVGKMDPLWVKADGRGLSQVGIRQIVRRRAQAAGIREPGMHAFRRSFAINSLRNGMDMITLKRLMGHESLETIQRYLAQVDDDLRLAHSRYGVVDKLTQGSD